MPADIKAWVGSFVLPGAGVTGAFDVTGIVDKDGAAFTPKVCMFFGLPDGFVDDPGTTGQHLYGLIGFDDGVTAVCHQVESEWGFNVPWTSSGSLQSGSIHATVAIFSPTTILVGGITAFASGQFTYTLTTNTFGGSRINVLAIGGDDLQYFIGKRAFTAGVTTSVTGVGFQPTGGIFTGMASITSNTPGRNWGKSCAIGFIDQHLTQVSSATHGRHGFSPYETASYQRLTRALVGVENTGTGIVTADSILVDSWDADGFTATGATGVVPCAYLLIGGCETLAGAITQPLTATGTLALATPDIDPRGIVYVSAGRAASSTDTSDLRQSLGTSDGTREAGSWFAALPTATVPLGMGGECWAGTTSSLLFATPVDRTSSNSTINGKLSTTGFSSELVSGSWTEGDGSEAREALYFVFGPEPEPRSPSRGIYVPTRGTAGSEGGGAGVSFNDLGGRVVPVNVLNRAVYVPTLGVGGAEGGEGRTMSVPAQSRVIYVEPTPRLIDVYDGEGYTHR